MNDNIDNDNCLNYTIQENDKSVKEILIDNLNFSRRLTVRLESNNKILLNGKPIKLRKRVYIGDELTIFFEDDSVDEYNAVNIPIKILYEDESLLIVDKPPFMVVHPTKSHFDDTLANGARYYFDSKNIKAKIRLVNRLDMNTSGIVIIAKNSYIHNEISKQMKKNEVDKYYYAICEGTILQDKGTINAPIARLQEDDIMRVVDASGKECITHYEVVDRFRDMTLLKIKLETGRTHQIRVHLKHIRHPIVGDSLYNKESLLINRQALHCSEMSFTHPIKKERITVKADLPADFKKIINE
ncbi:RluA family pseudouridine synthase [Sedimentibacter sp. zth1]|uniref:RluA family pseudouridine synthase n=1 Tax=Sedimentibacter sp. zth1 TaxID=2816908 RepID=UPI001A928E98|nr:RluA family pseudouridine synthase [Sedimentibacter sp. zth1]QSX04740.1 RluA family pseudouridine synthase [Sedimentibacter sp. zth1]